MASMTLSARSAAAVNVSSVLAVSCGCVLNITRTTHKEATGRRWHGGHREAAAYPNVVVWIFCLLNPRLEEVVESGGAQKGPRAL